MITNPPKDKCLYDVIEFLKLEEVPPEPIIPLYFDDQPAGFFDCRGTAYGARWDGEKYVRFKQGGAT